MKKLLKHITFLFLLFQIFSCDTVQTNKTESELSNRSKNVFGLYSYYVTGYNSHCESVKHSLRLNQDSTFIFKVYCYADSTSPFTPTIKNGKWTKQGDSVFHFICSDTTTFDIALLATEHLKIIRPKIDDRIIFEFSKDTMQDEKCIGKSQLSKTNLRHSWCLFLPTALIAEFIERTNKHTTFRLKNTLPYKGYSP